MPQPGLVHQLDPVAEGIIDIDPGMAWQELVLPGHDTGLFQPCHEAGCASPLSRTTTAAFLETVRLLRFLEAEEPLIEAPCRRLPAFRHGELDMVELQKGHFVLLSIAVPRNLA